MFLQKQSYVNRFTSRPKHIFLCLRRVFCTKNYSVGEGGTSNSPLLLSKIYWWLGSCLCLFVEIQIQISD